MTSKEALENLGRINLGDNPYCIFEDNLLKNCCKEEYEKIKKDLEVLEILKNESDSKRIIERDGIVSFHLDMILTADNYNKIKEWLENDNFLLKVAQIYSKKNNEKK